MNESKFSLYLCFFDFILGCILTLIVYLSSIFESSLLRVLFWIIIFLFIVVTIVTIVFHIFQFCKRKWLSSISFLFIISIILIIFILPNYILQYNINRKFNDDFSDYSKAIVAINKSTIKTGFNRLPKGFRHLTKDGYFEILKSEKNMNVLFYVYWGTFSDYKAIVYSFREEDFLFNTKSCVINHKRNNWYIVSGNIEDRD